MWRDYFCVSTVEEALQILAEQGEKARIVAGGTDLMLEMERGVRKGIETLVDVSRIPALDQIVLDEEDVFHLGPLVTHNHCVASKLLVERAFPLVQAAWEVGSPQIRNRGTVAGNLITASPANDTISPLMALEAKVVLRSLKGGRVVPLEEFYLGVRRTVMHPDEMLVDIRFPAMDGSAQAKQRGTFIKLSLRQAQAISLVNAAMILTIRENRVRKAVITLGAVAPTILHATEAEGYLAEKVLNEEIIEQAARLAMAAARPIDDVRGSADYRADMVRVCVSRGLRSIVQGQERSQFPSHPPLLRGRNNSHAAPLIPQSTRHPQPSPIVTRINGKEYIFTTGHQKTLLRLLREDAGLTGTKEGCAEGECGACTVHLDGMAVVSCLVPAPRAHGAVIVTIEGLASLAPSPIPQGEGTKLHPVQQAFIDEGAVQCGYCTPGFVMSAVKLLEENPHPRRAEIQQAISGNLCRCTGYYSIVAAIECAAAAMAHIEKPSVADRAIERASKSGGET
jgi:carbon-monoxide dehydrogenase medium subunit